MKANHMILVIWMGTFAGPLAAQGQSWEPVTGAEKLRKIFSNTVFESTLKGKNKATSRFNADGTGETTAWGETFTREWKIEGDDQICVLIDRVPQCFRLERNTSNDDEYRASNVSSGESVEFTVSPQEGAQEVATMDAPPTEDGGPVQPSAEELAAKLSNPTSPVMTIGNNFDYVTFKGDMPGAGGETAFRYVFQTVFPFKLSNGGSVFFRPALPVMFNEPVPDGMGSFSSQGTDLGDLGFDFSYGITTPGGLLWGAGLAGTMPTATNDKLGKDLWSLGPEILLGAIGKWGVVGAILAHQWDIGGSGKGETNLTSLSYFYAFPLGIGVAKTSIIGGRPWNEDK